MPAKMVTAMSTAVPDPAPADGVAASEQVVPLHYSIATVNSPCVTPLHDGCCLPAGTARVMSILLCTSTYILASSCTSSWN